MIWTPSLSLNEIPAYFVKGRLHPKCRPSDLMAGHVVEQIGNGGLSTRDQNAIRADLFVDMTLASALGPSSQTL